MTDPTVNTVLAGFAEKAIDQALQYDPGTRQKLKKLNGSRLNVICTQPSLEFTFDVVGSSIVTASKTEDVKHPAEVTLTGSFQDLAKLAKKDQHSLAESGVEVSGKAQLLVSFQDLFSNLDIDWEEALIEKFGNTAGHQIASLLRKTKAWSAQQHRDFKQFFPEYLTEEARVSPSKEEIDYFCEDVDKLRARYDRIEARVKRLKRSLLQINK